MQRLFSTFADGWPGTGILLLRVLAGGTLINSGIAAMSAKPYNEFAAVHAVAAGLGVLILGGLWTPVAGVMAGILELWIAFAQPDSQSLAIILAALGMSLAMIGPGAWSVDARLYGRKQILPPEP